MEFTKKMMLVDPRWLDTRQQGSPLPDPMGQSLRDLDSQMRDILERQDVSPHEKAHLYHQTLQLFLTRVNQYSGKPPRTVDVKPEENPQKETHLEPPLTLPTYEVEKNVLESVPSIFKKKAEQLLHHLKQNSDLSWNERGEISLQGQTIKNSNLIDLVNDVLRQRKQAGPPTGWEPFATALSQSNVAHQLIGHPDRWKYIHSQMQPLSKQADPSATPVKIEEEEKHHRKPTKKRRKSQKHSDHWEEW